jgi:hypothetical protein
MGAPFFSLDKAGFADQDHNRWLADDGSGRHDNVKNLGHVLNRMIQPGLVHSQSIVFKNFP